MLVNVRRNCSQRGSATRCKRVAQFARSEHGNAAIFFALVLPVLLGIVGNATDYLIYTSQRQHMQRATDAATLGAAQELAMSDARRQNASAVVNSMFVANLTKMTAMGMSPSLEVSVKDEPLELAVTARLQPTLPFNGAFGFKPDAIVTYATARVIGRPNICVLALDPSASGAISLEKNAVVEGRNCSVFSNSTHTNSIKSMSSAVLMAKLICSAGGKEGAKGNFTPDPLTDCPPFDDPLARRPEPPVEPCNSSQPGPVRVTQSTSLRPGTFCGGLIIEAGSVDLAPGVYVIKDGEFRVMNGAQLRGAGVGMFLTGNGAQLVFEPRSSIDLAAMESGPMAGLLIFEARSQSTSATHQILSDNARNLLGTIYVSRGRLHVDAENPIADQSAYTAIVARMLTLYGGPTLVLNSNYEQTNVPVPETLKGVNRRAILVK